MSQDAVNAVFIVCVTIIIILFWGEPDLMDAIKVTLTCK